MDKEKLVKAVGKIPEKVISAAEKEGIPDPRTEVKLVVGYNMVDSYGVFMNLLNSIHFWDQNGGGAKARIVGREIGDIGESAGIFEQGIDFGTPQERALFGGFVCSYLKKEPHKPAYLTTFEIFRDLRPELYDKVSEHRQHLYPSAMPQLFGKEVEKRMEELKEAGFVAISAERLGLDGRTVADPIILDSAFVDVEIDKSRVPYAREPMKVVSGEVLYQRLLNEKGFSVSDNPPPLKPVMKRVGLQAWGFLEYRVDEDVHCIGKVIFGGEPVLLGYQKGPVDYQLVNRPEMSLKGAKPFIALRSC